MKGFVIKCKAKDLKKMIAIAYKKAGNKDGNNNN